MKYLYKLDNDYHYASRHIPKRIVYSNDWLDLRNGCITVNKGYAWDGCTPRLDVLDLFTIGTPNGRLKEGKPITYYASCVHDVLCQFRHEHPLTQKQTTAIFDDMLHAQQFALRHVYTFAVNYLGPQKFKAR